MNNNPSSPKCVHVAVGVIVDDQSRILIALRQAESHQGGLWEFPGGKVELGETVLQALARELDEELGIKATAFRPLTEIQHDYGDKSVFLDVWWVDRFDGVAHGKEGQPIEWVAKEQLGEYRFPEANTKIIDAVSSLSSD